MYTSDSLRTAYGHLACKTETLYYKYLTCPILHNQSHIKALCTTTWADRLDAMTPQLTFLTFSMTAN